MKGHQEGPVQVGHDAVACAACPYGLAQDLLGLPKEALQSVGGRWDPVVAETYEEVLSIAPKHPSEMIDELSCRSAQSAARCLSLQSPQKVPRLRLRLRRVGGTVGSLRSRAQLMSDIPQDRHVALDAAGDMTALPARLKRLR